MEFVPDSCPICGGRFEYLYSIERFTPPPVILRCSECGLQRQASLPSPESLAAFYERGYYDGTASFSYQDERLSEPFHDIVWRARLRTIARQIPPPADFLDAGCSFGGLVASAERSGYRAKGIDLSAFAVEEGRKQNRDLYCATLEQNPFQPESFDIITMIEVIEHLPDPISAIRAIQKMLRKNGLLVIQTANFLGLQAKRSGAAYHYYLPGHLFYFSTNNLRRLLENEGFDRIRFFHGTDFGLLPKLRKMRGGFHSLSDYLRWIPVSVYHLKSKFAVRDFAWTSSMVCYARRK